MNKKYRVYFHNFEYFAQEEFDSVNGAIKYINSKGFEASIYYGDEYVAPFTPIEGADLNWLD